AEVERKMYRDSLLNHRAQILLSKQLATIHTQLPVEWDLATLKAKAPDFSKLKLLYKELEFFSLLKDLPPEDDSATRDYQTIRDEASVLAWLAERPPDAPLAVALDQTNGYLGLTYRVGSGRAIPLSLLETVRSVLEAETIPKVVHDA